MAFALPKKWDEQIHYLVEKSELNIALNSKSSAVQ